MITLIAGNPLEFNKLKEKQSQLMRKCIEIEKPFRNQLERICVDCAVELFNINIPYAFVARILTPVESYIE